MLDPFLKHRREQQAVHERKVAGRRDSMDSLISVEINVMDACNRTCSFCPHADPKMYPNQPKWRMPLETSRNIARQLATMKSVCRVSFSGYGEPLMDRNVYQHVKTYRRFLPDNTIEMNTNGDALNVDRIQRLFTAGLTAIYVNLYDGPEQVGTFTRMFEEAGVGAYHLRPHFDEKDDWGLTLNNRSGLVNPLADPMAHRCHYPFYKMFIDWNGSVLFCANDWGRNIIVGNVLGESIKDIWLSDKMKEIRLRLAVGDRSHHPCSGCDVDGTLHGEFSFAALMDYYG